MRRKKPMGKGKKRITHNDAIRYAMDEYFERFGWNEDGLRFVYCQLTGRKIIRAVAVMHHKTPRSEMRKAGITDLDAPRYLLCLSRGAHRLLHGNGKGDKMGMGRPTIPFQADYFAMVEASEANAANGKAVIPRTI